MVDTIDREKETNRLKSPIRVTARVRKTEVRLRIKLKKARLETLKTKQSQGKPEVKISMRTKAQNKKWNHITSLKTCSHCKWQDAVKGSVFFNKALVCDVCQRNFPVNLRSLRETLHRCNRCGLISNWRQRNRVHRDYYPSDGEEEN